MSSGAYSNKHTVVFIYRTNAQSRLIEEACVRFNVPYVIFGSFTSFYNRQEVKDCLCFLRWLHNGYDRVAMLRAIETPKRGLGGAAVREFDEYCDKVAKCWNENHPSESKPNALNVLFHLSGDHSWCSIPNPQFPPPENTISARPLKIFRDFSKDMVYLQHLAAERTVSQILQIVLDIFKLRPHFEKLSKTEHNYKERLLNVDELINAAVQYDEDGASIDIEKPTTPDCNEEFRYPLKVFLENANLFVDSADSFTTRINAGEAHFVARLMTIHSSKGMEFDTVFFIGVEDGLIPSEKVMLLQGFVFCVFIYTTTNTHLTISHLPQSLGKGEGSIPFEEERRLCYVAMTRAKSELLITWRRITIFSTFDGLTEIKQQQRSRFLDVLMPKEKKESYIRLDQDTIDKVQPRALPYKTA